MQKKPPASKLRKIYTARLIGRCITLLLCILLYIFLPQQFEVLEGMNFFHQLSWLHILWVLWCIDMLKQIIPAKGQIALGSQKHFLFRFRPLKDKINIEALKNHVISTTKSAYRVFILWGILTLLLGFLYLRGVISGSVMILISVVFYVCDLICVLIWCPFRLIMGNRCCTTCRIFNWDHLMMFSPLIFVGGFYALSLFFLSVLVFVVWELCIVIYPERFWEISNTALRCSECTDKLCTQYCQKLRPANRQK